MRFSGPSPLLAELRQVVDGYFERTGRSRHGGFGLHLKTVVLLATLATSYTLLLVADLGALGAVLLAVLLGLAMAGVGFNVMHDGNHGSYSKSARVNRLLGATLDLLGGSSFLWKQKHNVLHHTFTNVHGVDSDIEGNVLLRFAPSQPRRPWHRFQHLYVWLAYALYPLAWWFFEDFHRAATGRAGGGHIRRPRGRELAGFVAGKAIFFGWAFVLPVVVRPTWAIVPITLVVVATLGNTLAVVFQLAHCVGEADFHDVARPQALARDWAVHQVTTTVDFARHDRLLSWFLGGLNFQIEHHLFPKVSHVHYPALAPLIEKVCNEHGVRYRSHDSLRAAIGSNVRWLRRLGQASATPRPPGRSPCPPSRGRTASAREADSAMSS